MTVTAQQLAHMSYHDLCVHWATEYVETLTLSQLRQVTAGNMSCIKQFPVLQRAHQVWCEIKKRETATERVAPKLIFQLR